MICENIRNRARSTLQFHAGVCGLFGKDGLSAGQHCSPGEVRAGQRVEQGWCNQVFAHRETVSADFYLETSDPRSLTEELVAQQRRLDLALIHAKFFLLL